MLLRDIAVASGRWLVLKAIATRSDGDIRRLSAFPFFLRGNSARKGLNQRLSRARATTLLTEFTELFVPKMQGFKVYESPSHRRRVKLLNRVG